MTPVARVANRRVWLEIDSGNTRTKWRLWDEAARTVTARGVTENNSEPALRRLPWDRCEWVRAVNVAGAEVQSILSDSARAAQRPTIRFVASAAACGDVRNGYLQPQALGADRWSAIVGAARHVTGDVVIVDAGSAVTVDLLSAAQQHLGGYIGPGLRLARESLGAGTDAVQVAADMDSDLSPGRSTATAVHAALLAMAIGLVDNAVVQMRSAAGTGAEPAVLITGGDASVLMTQGAHRGWRHVPDLVLDGLAAAAGV